jgi:hypothetical protein
MPVRVIFEYDEDAAKWAVLVTEASDETEAKQAFAAVVMTCQMLIARLQVQALTAQTPEGVAIAPAV